MMKKLTIFCLCIFVVSGCGGCESTTIGGTTNLLKKQVSDLQKLLVIFVGFVSKLSNFMTF